MKLENLNNNNIPVMESFKNPSSLYKGAPFWSWNGDLKKDELFRQIDVFEEMGIGGFHIHPRTGMTTEYLGKEYIDLIKACRDYAKNKGMLTWLYDEDRWPSGYGGGLVTKNKEYRIRNLLITTVPYGERNISNINISKAYTGRNEKGTLLKIFAVNIKNKFLQSYRIIKNKTEAKEIETVWYIYLEVAINTSWFNNQTYVDVLNPKAIQKFIEITHTKYQKEVGDSFGKEIPAIFTDEPQFIQKKSLKFANDTNDIILPWTQNLEEEFSKQYGSSILEKLPELIWDLPKKEVSKWRYYFHEWVAERFAESFADQLGNWCSKNKIALTGHLMEEPTLESQTNSLGDTMRSYRSFGIPGIDILCDKMELSTAKQAQSASRQYGRPGVLSELYGVTGWDYDFKGHKQQGDWQAALGVTFRAHHLTWYNMKGEAKRDYPASIGYQSPWYKEYKSIENHFSRLNSILSRGKAICNVAVIHPIESYWLCAGPYDTSASEREDRQTNFDNVNSWLLYGGIDFDFVAESLLHFQSDSVSKDTFGVGEMEYKVVIVPSIKTIRLTTLIRLEKFANNGGEVIFAGEIPSYIDVKKSTRALELSKKSTKIILNKGELLNSLEDYRTIELRTKNGNFTSSLLYQLREENNDRYLFICNTNKYMKHNSKEDFFLTIKGTWKINSLNTKNGNSKEISSEYKNGNTILDLNLEAVEHLLFHLKPGEQYKGISFKKTKLKEVSRLNGIVPITLDEDNVLLLDKAEFCINGGKWQKEEQLLYIENVLRKELGMPEKSGNIAQPWTDKSPVVKLADISIRISFESLIDCKNIRFGLENLKESTVIFDGKKVSTNAVGFFTDKSIETIKIPDFNFGKHTIEINIQFTKETSIEWMYLLGDFGVDVLGKKAVITNKVKELAFGNWVNQGLPFYGGNVTYHCKAEENVGTVMQIHDFKATALKVETNKKETVVYAPPYYVNISLKDKENINIKAFGHRANCFGQVHLIDESIFWKGPESYRTKGASSCTEYNLKPLGIMSAPIIFVENK